MITFQSPHDIDKIIRSTGRLEGVENFDKAEEYYGTTLIHIIKLLVQPPKDNSLNRAVQEYKESQEEEDNENTQSASNPNRPSLKVNLLFKSMSFPCSFYMRRRY